MKSKNKLFLISISILILIIGYQFINALNSSSEKNLENEIAELVLDSRDLLNAFTKNEEKSDSLYAGKILEISGIVKEVTFLNNRNTLILYGNSNENGIICDLNPNQKEKLKHIKKHQKVFVKGICKGFLKDVILLNCTIYFKPNE